MEDLDFNEEMSRDISEEEFELPIDELIVLFHRKGCIPATYGKVFARKVISISDGLLTGISQREDLGDCLFNGGKYDGKYGEIKITYLNKNKRYRITNIRVHQKFDFFILCFVDTGDCSNPKFFVIPKNALCKHPALKFTAVLGTKEANRNNMIMPVGTHIDRTDENWLFDNYNMLKGTKSRDLIDFFKSIMAVSVKEKETSKNIISVIKKYKKRELVKFMVTDNYTGRIKEITGDCNLESMINLVRHMGPKNIKNCFWRSFLSKTPSKYRQIHINGYYLNPHFSIRDIRKVVKSINKRNRFSVVIFNK